MSKKAYSEEERDKIRHELIATALKFFAEQGIQHTTLSQIYESTGISKTFFYTFFTSKAELVAQAMLYQQPLLLNHARELVKRTDMSWRDKVRKFLRDCCYGNKTGIAVMSIEEEQELYRHITREDFEIFQRKQVMIFSEYLNILGVPVGSADPRLVGNLALSMIMTYKAIPHTMPFLFAEAADEMVDFQIEAIIDYLEEKKNEVKA